MAQPKKAVQRQRSREKEVVDFASKLNIRSQKQVKLREKEKSMKWEFPLKKNNMYVLAIGLGIIILGYLLMAWYHRRAGSSRWKMEQFFCCCSRSYFACFRISGCHTLWAS